VYSEHYITSCDIAYPGNTSVDEFEEDKPEADAAPTNTTNQKMSANLNNDLKNSCLIS
jgi:hypothetical protein